MKNNIRAAAALIGILLAGCADLLNGPPIVPDASGDGRLVITIGSGAERSVGPKVDQFSKITLSFEQKNGSGTMSPIEVEPGETVISLNPGTWELTASAYNRANPPVVIAQAKNTLTRTGDRIEGNTYFGLVPTGTGPGILRYTIAPPEGIALDTGGSYIKIAKDGAAPGEELHIPLNGAVAGVEKSLVEGRYTVGIVLDDQASSMTAVYWEAAAILPGLVTEIVFTPQADEFLDPDVRASLTNVANVKFGRTRNNSALVRIGEAGGAGADKSQALLVPNGTETLCFTLTGLRNQRMSIGGANPESVSCVTSGTVDGSTAKSAEPVFTVNIPRNVADYGGTWDFTLALDESGKTPVVYAVAIHIPSLAQLGVINWPSKWVYKVGEEFDPAGLELVGLYTDETVVPVNGGYTLEGFDTASPGDRNVRIKKHGLTGYEADSYNGNYSFDASKDFFRITVVSAGALVFDPELEAEHDAVDSNNASIGAPPSGYTVGPGRTVVLAPIKFLIPNDAVYEWTVDNNPQSATTEYLVFAYESFGAGNHVVTVTAKVNNNPVATGTTTVNCASGAIQRQTESTSQAVAEKLFSVVAPGQFGSGSGRLGAYNGFGGYGGYAVFKFDHSVPKNGVDGKEIKVGGNTGPWTEPGAVWVSMDENRNGLPDDTWYELKGSHTLAGDTLRRYAVTFRSDYTWVDNLGGGGTYPPIQAYPARYGDSITLTGTRLHHSLVGQEGVWGYADVYDDQRNSFSNAIQANGDPVDLPFVDFVKVVTAIHYADTLLGERSTEAGTPKDMTLNDPQMMMTGSNRDGLYYYTFKNDSGYDLTITFEGNDFLLARKGTTTTTIEKSSSAGIVYIDYRGGNVSLEIQGAEAVFINGLAD